jgi:hypothetical protein
VEFFETRYVVLFGLIFFVASLILPERVEAYVDPGTTGMLSQLLYVLFYSALGAVFYSLRSIKEYLARAKRYLMTYLTRKS